MEKHTSQLGGEKGGADLTHPYSTISVTDMDSGANTDTITLQDDYDPTSLELSGPG